MSPHRLNAATPADTAVAEIKSKFLTEDQAADAVRHSRRTLIRWREQGTGPAFTRLGRRIVYRRDTLESWMRGQEVSP